MYTYSVLQQQFPLSPKKFMKKMIEKLLALYIIAVVLAAVFLVLIFVNTSNKDPMANTILWGILIVGVVLLAVITALYGWYVKTYIKRYYYDGEENFITIKKGVFAPTEIHVQWQKIQDVYVDQDILDRIMGLYDVHIASATVSSGIEAHIDGVDYQASEGLKKFFLGKVSGTGVSSPSSGSFAVNNSSSQNGSQNSQSNTLKVNLSEEISDKKYPLLGKWLAISIVSRTIGSLFFLAIFFFVFISKATVNSTSSSHVGIDISLLIYCGLGVIALIVNIISLILWKKNYSFNFTPEHIYYKTGVLSISEKHMPYSSIQDVTVSQSFLERIFGLAKVNIENAAQNQIAISTKRGAVPVFNGVQLVGLLPDDANKITEILKSSVLGKNMARHGL